MLRDICAVDDLVYNDPNSHIHNSSTMEAVTARRPSSQGSFSPRPYNGGFSPSTASEPEFSSSTSSSSYSTPATSPGFRRSIDSCQLQLPAASVQILRCLRCARSVEATTTDDVSTMGMVRIAHNLHYCERCAKMVGYTK
jgi:hypothetical protein